MRLLLDTHIALWAITGSARLPHKAAALMNDQVDRMVVSVVTLWEISIKHALARGRPSDMPLSAAAALSDFTEAGFEILPVTAHHVLSLETLSRRHGDPFDRLLAAQALAESLVLLTHDVKLAAYSDRFLLV